jgi:hypothetical protein
VFSAWIVNFKVIITSIAKLQMQFMRAFVIGSSFSNPSWLCDDKCNQRFIPIYHLNIFRIAVPL